MVMEEDQGLISASCLDDLRAQGGDKSCPTKNRKLALRGPWRLRTWIVPAWPCPAHYVGEPGTPGPQSLLCPMEWLWGGHMAEKHLAPGLILQAPVIPAEQIGYSLEQETPCSPLVFVSLSPFSPHPTQCWFWLPAPYS